MKGSCLSRESLPVLWDRNSVPVPQAGVPKMLSTCQNNQITCRTHHFGRGTSCSF